MASSAVEPPVAANLAPGPQKRTRQATLNASLRLTGASTASPATLNGTGSSKPGPSAFASIISLPPSAITREKLRDVENDVEILLSAHQAGHISKRIVENLAEVQCPSCDAWVKSNAGKTVHDLVKASHFYNLRTHRASARCAAARAEMKKESSKAKIQTPLSFPILSSDSPSKPSSQIQQPPEHATLPQAPSSRRSSVHVSEPPSAALMDYDLGDDFQPWRSRKSPERELLPHEYLPDRDPFADYDNPISPRTSLHPDQPFLLMNGSASAPDLSLNFHDNESNPQPTSSNEERLPNTITIAPIDTHSISPAAQQPLSAFDSSDAMPSSAISELSNPPLESSADPAWPEDISLSAAIASTRLALEELFTVYTTSLDPPPDNSSIIGDAPESISAQSPMDVAPSISARASASRGPTPSDIAPTASASANSHRSKSQSQGISQRRKSTTPANSGSSNSTSNLNQNSGPGPGPCLGVPIVWPSEAGPFFTSFPFSRLGDDVPDSLPFTLEITDGGNSRLARAKTCKGVAAPRSGPKCRQCASVKYAVARLVKEAMAGSDEDREGEGSEQDQEKDQDGSDEEAEPRAKLRGRKQSTDTTTSRAPSEPRHQHRQSGLRDRDRRQSATHTTTTNPGPNTATLKRRESHRDTGSSSKHSSTASNHHTKLQQSASVANLRRRDANVDERPPSAHLRDRRQSTGAVGGGSLKRKDQASESVAAAAAGGRKVARRS
ncbi:hypothetical protein CONPUDRAFT_164370 [Coniophora puteana RWD-64-598 SS2]|uniref:Uncharacterized protein n=1 Tax=Coniophora puteana (strain RWD-64-598) TaxID=741705 RepID=A0A5M3MWQ0_CONPW|nr:uncharacterized protein CONPUDRAFT_164370 [Coniophora puteana RWD-64-598 SS2]EIW83417.1 hypothetical protein CONPUDRAFT_164370 [Coniophora puteana RWD-64-598 SS2]